ncbi:MAG: ATP-dependent DNA helicase RecG [Planctomycetota bacterium]|nr:ATP-dependent DNA helicase RecG [Planctomycetota bacterium]
MSYPERTDIQDQPSIASGVSVLPGFQTAWKSRLAKLQLHTIGDLLFFFPRDYECLAECVDLDSIANEETNLSVQGTITDTRSNRTRFGKATFTISLTSGNSMVRATWFSMPYLKNKYRTGDEVLLSGIAKPKVRGKTWEMTHPRIVLLTDDEQATGGEVLPVYSLTSGITQATMRRIMRLAVENYADLLEEVFPDTLLTQKGICSIQQAIQQIHCPTTLEEAEASRFRFIYQELLVLQLALALRRWQLASTSKAPVMETDARIHARITSRFPFTLTQAQQHVVQEITEDMASARPMNRLLQGDVGSGKTVVAEYAMLLCVAHQQQAVLMAPTEILAQQHYQTLTHDLRQSRVKIGVLTGSTKAVERKQVLQEIASGEMDLLIGTHSLANDELEFQSLALVVIDEQHKFGVRQRLAVRKTGLDPHYLVMSATPIPRTVAMGLFADLDISTLRTGPTHQQTVHTYLGHPEQREAWWEFFRKKLREGRQGFVIASVIQQESNTTLKSADFLYQQLRTEILSDFRIGLIHGRLSAAEKNETMQQFANHELDVLVATSVVEVGVNVPNASLLTIEDAQQFGLAQLHQFRGRIRRGHHPGYVCVFGTPGNDDAEQRLQTFVNTLDGFELAEADFKMRGPGDLFGTKQHGMPPLRIADLHRDVAILKQARDDALALIDHDPGLQNLEMRRLRKQVLRRYGQVLDVGDVG